MSALENLRSMVNAVGFPGLWWS